MKATLDYQIRNAKIYVTRLLGMKVFVHFLGTQLMVVTVGLN